MKSNVRAAFAVTFIICALAASACGAEGMPGFLPALTKQAETGDAVAQCQLGWVYETGYDGIPKDYARARKWYGAAAENGNLDAIYAMGQFHRYALGTPEDIPAAMEWYRKAAIEEYPDAEYKLGLHYHLGEGVAQDIAKARDWYLKAAGQGHAGAQYNLASLHAGGQLGAPDYGEAYFWMSLAQNVDRANCDSAYCASPMLEKFIKHLTQEEIAEIDGEITAWKRGHPRRITISSAWTHAKPPPSPHMCVSSSRTWTDLGSLPLPDWFYATRIGLFLDMTDSAAYESIEPYVRDKMLSKKPYTDDAAELYLMAFGYLDKRDNKRDNAEAARWFRRSAEKGFAPAQYMMFRYYTAGDGVPVDGDKALAWLRKAAEQQYEHAICSLARRYMRGRGVPLDYPEAARLLQQLEQRESSCAMDELGMMAFNGEGTGQDYAAAAKYWRSAADKGSVRAQANLGLLYARGIGVEQDDREAYRLFLKASTSKDYPFADTLLGTALLEGRGTARDVESGVKLLADAAMRGDAAAQHVMARLTRVGTGMPQDPAASLVWLHKAADQGYTQAQEELSMHYIVNARQSANGYAEAYFWQLLSQKTASADRKTRGSGSDSLRDQLDPAEAARVEQRVEAWLAQHPD